MRFSDMLPSKFLSRRKTDQPHDITNSAGKTTLRWKLVIFLSLLFPVILETLDYTIVATAQVNIASYFNRLDLQSYVGSVYLLTSTVFLPIFSSVADIFGRHCALQLGLVTFMAGSAISTGAQNMTMMLAGRGIAGTGAAGLLTVVRIILADSASLDENNWQTTIVFVLYSIAFAIGPSVGGLLTSISFRWIFAINLPCCALAIVICFVLLRGRAKGGRAPRNVPVDSGSEPLQETVVDKLLHVDWFGAVLFIGGAILFLLALNWGSSNVWKSAKVIASFIVGGLLIISCFMWQYYLERQQSSPTASRHRILAIDALIPLEVLRSRNVSAVLFACFADGMVMMVMFYFIAIFMTIVSGRSPTSTGLQLLYFLPGMGGGSWTSLYLIKKLRQPKYPIIASGLLFCVSLGLISLAVRDNKEKQINGFMAMSGVAVGLSMGSLPVQARFSQPDDKIAIVAALQLFTRSLGGTVGLAQCGAVMNSRVASYIMSLARSGQISSAEATQLVALGATSIHDLSSFPASVQIVFQNAFRDGTRWCFISLIPWCGVSFLLTLFLDNIVDPDKKPDEREAPISEVENKEKAEDAAGDLEINATRI